MNSSGPGATILSRTWSRFLVEGRLFPALLAGVTLVCAVLLLLPDGASERISPPGDPSVTRVSLSLAGDGPHISPEPRPSPPAAPPRTRPGPEKPGPSRPKNEGSPGTGGRPTGSDPGARRDYLSGVIRKVARHKRYPRVEKEREQESEVVVSFVILASGKIENLRLVQPSPYPGFNREALASVHRSLPFPAIPREMGRSSLPLRIRLKFRLEDS